MNEQETELIMKLGSAGEAFVVHETTVRGFELGLFSVRKRS